MTSPLFLILSFLHSLILSLISPPMHYQIQTPLAPQTPAFLSQAIAAQGLIFVAGQIHVTPEGTMIEGSVEDKMRQIMQNIQVILQSGGSDLNQVVKATVYVTDMAQMPKLNEVYPTYFSEPFPAREAVCVKELPRGATIEISVIAVKE
jgi:2-iminobutanoate/2-iminopropanoate deaminase